MSRVYVPYPQKHKVPKGFGTLCPARMPAHLPQELLQLAVEVEGVGANKLWAASGSWCFCAHRSVHAGEEAWHGFPVIGGEVDERVLSKLEEVGMISAREKRRLRRQRRLPDSWD